MIIIMQLQCIHFKFNIFQTHTIFTYLYILPADHTEEVEGSHVQAFLSINSHILSNFTETLKWKPIVTSNTSIFDFLGMGLYVV